MSPSTRRWRRGMMTHADQRAPQERGPRLLWSARSRRIHVLAISVVAVGCCALAVRGVQVMYDVSAREVTWRRFQEVARSLVDYSEVFGRLPFPVTYESPGQLTDSGAANESGRPLYSWRVEIVRYLMGWHGSWDRSRPWNDASNERLVELSTFYAYDAVGPEGHPKWFPETNVLAITGPGTAFGDGADLPSALSDVPPDTILLAEVRASGILWPAPGDFDIRTMPRALNGSDGKGVSSRYRGGFHVVFADGQVWFLSERLPFETLEYFLTTVDAEKPNREELLGPFALRRGL